MEENRKKALVAALGQIEKQFGKGSVMRLGDAAAASYDVEAISTGSLGLDIALGVGGLPRGRVIEIYGPESSGKTTLALTAIAQAQRAAARRPSSMPSTRSTRPTPRSSASTSTSCWSRSRTTASRRSRSPTCWSAPARSTSSSSTRSRR